MAPRKDGGGKAAVSEGTEKKLRNLNPFKPGQSGNPAGRPKSSRNKLGEAFLEALHDDFTAHGVAAIQAARADNPLGYIKVCASILPRDLNININPLEELTDDQLIERIGQLEHAVQSALGRTGEAQIRVGASSGDKPASKVPAVH